MHPLIRRHLPEVNALCRQHGVRRLVMFGSAANARETIGDLDFLVEFERLDPDTYADAYFGLLEELEKLLAVLSTW